MVRRPRSATPAGSDASTTDSATTGDSGSGIPGPGMGTLAGPQSFPVASAMMATAPTAGCGGTAASASVIPQVGILLTAQGLPSLLCTDAGPPDAGVGGWLEIVIATSQAIAGASPLTDSVAPGTYVIGDEGVDDPDPCMLPNGSNAYIQLLTPGGYDAQATAISGTVVIDSVSATSVTGTFSVLMGGPYGFTDASPPPSLSGAFDALACP